MTSVCPTALEVGGGAQMLEDVGSLTGTPHRSDLGTGGLEDVAPVKSTLTG